MKLYEILDEMENCIDAETGEVDTDKLTALQEERDTKLEGVGLWVLDLQSDIAKIKAEKSRLDERQKACERKIESLKNWLAYALAGEKLKTEKVTIGYRTSKSVIIDNIYTYLPHHWAVYACSCHPKYLISALRSNSQSIRSSCAER